MTNPWKVDSIQAFSCLKCPECTFNTKEEYFFQDHALNNHPLSQALFDDRSLKLFNKETKSRSTNVNLTEESSKSPAENIQCVESEAKKAKTDYDQHETSQFTTKTNSDTEQKSTIQATNKNKKVKKDFVRGIPKNLKPDEYRIGSDLCRSEFFMNSADLRDGIGERLKCVICDENGQSYDTVSDVQAHVVLDHIGENPHQIECYYCKCDTFIYEISLYGQKYECPKCLHIYNWNIGLVSHEDLKVCEERRRKYKERKMKQKEQTKRDKEDFENCWNKHESHFCCGCGGSFVHQKID